LKQNNFFKKYMTDAYIFDALRTPRGKGKSSGSLHEVRAIDMLSDVLKDLQKRHQLDTSLVDDGIFGCVTPMDEQGGNIAKASLLFADWHPSVGGIQINRYCCSGLDAVNLAAMKIRSGLEDLIVAGGVESMSRVPMGADEGPIILDPDVVGKINYIPQGVAADLVATIEGINREELDAYAVQSQRRAFYAQSNGFFDKSIVPIRDFVGLVILDKDEYPRPDTSLETLSVLKPSFKHIGEIGFDAMAQNKYPSVERVLHLHTAGNSSGIVDGAAAVLVGTKDIGKKIGIKPRARVIATATVSTEPTIMLTGHIAAARKALKKAGMDKKDIDLWEVNEAFSVVALKFLRDMDLDDTIFNVNGGAIALGHPLGATGAMLLGTVLDELERRNLSTALIALCGGAGMGVATIIERI
jgi:acetyl-CoA C-acetyltransferase